MTVSIEPEAEVVWPVKPFNEVTKDLLWTAMGDPNADIRWMATHCVVDELLRAPNEIDSYVKRLPCADFAPCVAKSLPTYIYDSRMHFLLALAKVSKQLASEIRNNATEIVTFLRNQEHVLIRYIGWKALIDAGVKREMLHDLNPFGFVTVQKVSGPSWAHKAKVIVDEHIKKVIGKHVWVPLHYDFEKYWVSQLMRVFGLDNDGHALLAWAASSMVGVGTIPAMSGDPRRSQFYDEGSTKVCCSGMPTVSDYNFYASYHSLLILAGKMLKYQPVIKYTDDREDGFSEWMKELLPVFAPDLNIWQSDVRGNLPRCIAYGDELKEMIEQQPLMDIDVKKLLCLAGNEGGIIIDGELRIGEYAKEFECSLNCALVAKKSAAATRSSMRRMKDPTSLALPTFFDKSEDDWRNHGKFNWRGLYDSEHGYLRYHLDENDPAAGGLHIVRFDVARTICRDLQLRDGGDHISLLRNDGRPAFVSWYWGNVPRGRNASSGTYGCTLMAAKDFLSELCNMYCSELIVELVLKRYKRTYQRDYAERDEIEKCYRYVLFSPKKGLY